MKQIIDIIESNSESQQNGKMWRKIKPHLDQILQKCGWPKSKWSQGQMKSIDEDTTISFELDDYYWDPYISNIKCKFYGGSENTLRELNGLVDLYKEIHKYDWESVNK